MSTHLINSDRPKPPSVLAIPFLLSLHRHSSVTRPCLPNVAKAGWLDRSLRRRGLAPAFHARHRSGFNAFISIRHAARHLYFTLRASLEASINGLTLVDKRDHSVIATSKLFTQLVDSNLVHPSAIMSLESALAEEARDVVAILEGRSLKQTQRVRAASPAGMAQSPVRSMLDIGNTSSPKARHASVAGAAVGVTKPGSPFSQHEPIRSMLDTTTPPRPPTSPPITLARASSKSPPPPAVRQIKPSKFDPESAYQFDILPSSDRNALPKRVTQGGKKTKGAMASVFASSDDVRRGSFLGGANASRSPGPRLPAGRSESPATRKLNTNSMNLMTGPGKFVVSDSGHLIDMTNAYRRLSDVALLKSGGSLSQLPARKDYNKDTGEQITPDGGVRLAKDYQNPTEDEDAIETSDEENSSSDELGEDHRGRGRTRKGSNEAVEDDEAAEKRKPKSLLAAAEQERMPPLFPSPIIQSN